MTQRQFSEALHGATEFVLNLVDEFGRRSGIERLVNAGVELHYTSGEPLPEQDLEAAEPLSFVRIKETESGEKETTMDEGIAVLEFGDDSVIELGGDELLDFDEDEETLDQDDDAPLEFVEDEELTGPLTLRPTRDEMGENMAREMLIDASGGSSDDDPADRVNPHASPGPWVPDPDA